MPVGVWQFSTLLANYCIKYLNYELVHMHYYYSAYAFVLKYAVCVIY